MIDDMSAARPQHLEEGRAALREGDGPRARQAFELAMAESPSGDAAEGLARALYLELSYADAIGLWEQAYAAHRAAGDALGAVRVARTLAGIYGTVVGDAAVMSGWMARAKTLLTDAPDSSERGWVALNQGMFEGDRNRKDELFRQAVAAGRDRGDADLEFVALAYLGASLVHADKTEEGMVLLDEALAAVAGGEIDDFSGLEEIFCQLFAACEHARDVRRADEWMRIGDAIATRRNLPSVGAFCHTHYGGILTAAGRWPEADAALTEAIRLWGLGQRSGLKRGALVRLADLRVRQGRFEEAERLLEGMETDIEAAGPLAAVRVAYGQLAIARDILERALEQVDESSAEAAHLVARLVDVHLAEGDVDAARRAVERLSSSAARHDTDAYLQASAALARGRVCLASGTGDPKACLREALAGFAKAQLPVELARCRLELAIALAVDQPDVALAEARAALDAFERIEAAREADAAAAVLRTLGVRPASGKRGVGILTKREAEVLELLGHGLSNPEISDRLYISRKTVEHHVGNILAKLGLRGRAEAAAYATRAESAQK